MGSLEYPFDPGQKRRYNLDLNSWELPGVFQKQFARHVKRDGVVDFGNQKLKLDEKGFVEYKDVKYVVMEGIDTPEKSIVLGENVNILSEIAKMWPRVYTSRTRAREHSSLLRDCDFKVADVVEQSSNMRQRQSLCRVNSQNHLLRY